MKTFLFISALILIHPSLIGQSNNFEIFRIEGPPKKAQTIIKIFKQNKSESPSVGLQTNSLNDTTEKIEGKIGKDIEWVFNELEIFLRTFTRVGQINSISIHSDILSNIDTYCISFQRSKNSELTQIYWKVNLSREFEKK